MSPAGTSVNWPMCLYSSVMKLWQKRMTSPSLFPFGSKSLPPLPPPMGSVVRLFFSTCSNPRNLMTDAVTDGWKRSPPLYGPIALLNCTRKPRFTCTFPLSSTQGTANWMNRSGSTKRSMMPFFSYSGCCSNHALEALEHLHHCLMELALSRVAGQDGLVHSLEISVCQHLQKTSL